MARYQQLFDPIRTSVVDLWIEDSTPSVNGIARTCDELRTSGGRESYSTPLRTALDHLRREEILLIEERPEGSREGWAILGFNYTGRPAAGQTLADALRPFLRDEAVSEQNRQLAKEAVRRTIEGMVPVEVAGTRSDEALLVAASHVPAERIRELPGRARALPLGKAKEYARAIRNLMRHAGANGSVVMIMRPPRAISPWQVSIDQVFSLPATGRLSSVERSRRAWMGRLRTTLDVISGATAAATLDELSPAEVKRALEHLETVDADVHAAREIRAILIGLGEQGIGPYKALAEARTQVYRVTDRHYGAVYTLVPADGTMMEATWENLIHTLQTHGVGEDDIAFVRFLADYTDLDGESLERKYDHKLIRPAIRELRGMSYTARIQACRTYYGIALLDLKWPPAEATISAVFGHRFPELTLRLRALWEERATVAAALAADDIPVRGFPATMHAQTLERLVINGGLIASTAFERSRWMRGLEGILPDVDEAGREKPIRVDGATIVSTSGVSADELRWMEAYRYANAKAEEIKRKRGENRRTHRDVRAIVEDLPSMALVPSYLEHLRKRVQGSPNDRDVMAAAVLAFAYGIICTGGPRVGELPKVRIGVNFGLKSGDRFIDLAGSLRKVTVQHVLVIHDALVPDWLYGYVLDVARPALVREWIATQGPKARDHGFLLVRRNGSPLVDRDWSASSVVPSAQCATNASGQLLSGFARWRLQQLKSQGYKIVKGGWGHHTPHTARHQINQAGIALGFTKEQMGLLLGHQGETMGQIAYTAAVARQLADMITKILAEKPWVRGYRESALVVTSSTRR